MNAEGDEPGKFHQEKDATQTFHSVTLNVCRVTQKQQNLRTTDPPDVAWLFAQSNQQ